MSESCFIVKLPLELLQEIGSHLHSDSDLMHYTSSCKEIYSAIEQDNGSFWRRRFMTVFDKPEFAQSKSRSQQNSKYRRLYMVRRSMLKSTIRFQEGKRPNEERSLMVLKEMFVQSFSKARGDHTKDSKNLHHLLQFANSLNIHVPFVPARNCPLHWRDYPTAPTIGTRHLYLIQCLLAPTVLQNRSSRIGNVFAFSDSQARVYSSRPFFGGYGEIDLESVVHHLNFWKFWLANDPSHVLNGGFSLLDESERPQYWNSKLSNGPVRLGQRWKGTYAFLPERELRRLRANSRQAFQDEFPGEDDGQPFQDMDLELVDEKAHYWPEAFERYVNTLTRRATEVLQVKTRAQRRAMQDGDVTPASVRFNGRGLDQKDDFVANGWLKPLPSQMDMPGWHRMTMMKYYIDPHTGVIDENSLWAYEGVVLPGSKIIVGRWWRADVNDQIFYSGPFILWCVDE